MSKVTKTAEAIIENVSDNVVDAVSDVVTVRQLSPKKIALVGGIAVAATAAIVVVAKLRRAKKVKVESEIELVPANKD